MGAGLSVWLLDREAASAREGCIATRGSRPAWLDLTSFSRVAGKSALVLAAAARLGDHELVATETGARLLRQKPGFPLLLRLAVLQ